MSLPMSDAPITAGIQRSYGGWDLSDAYWKGFYLTLRADRRRLHFMLRCLKPALGKDITLVIVQDWEEYYKSCDHFMEACLYCRQPRCARCDRSSRATGTEICYCMRPTRSSTRLNNKRRFSVSGSLFTMVPLHACYPLLYEDDY